MSYKKWGFAEERDLAMAIILSKEAPFKDGTPSKSPTVEWAKVATMMTTLGHTFTKDAMS